MALARTWLLPAACSLASSLEVHSLEIGDCVWGASPKSSPLPFGKAFMRDPRVEVLDLFHAQVPVWPHSFVQLGVNRLGFGVRV